MFRLLAKSSLRFALAGLLAFTVAAVPSTAQRRVPSPPEPPLTGSIQPRGSDPEAIVERQFRFTIEANTRVKELLPMAPKMADRGGRVIGKENHELFPTRSRFAG